MSGRPRRSVDIFNLSFLDVISCGFGAIILLLVIVRVSEPTVLEELSVDLSTAAEDLKRRLPIIYGDTDKARRQLEAKQEQLSRSKDNIARLRAELSELRGRYAASKNRHEELTRIERQLSSATQTLSAEMKRLLGAGYRRPSSAAPVGGIPVDSEYVIFIIDTSGSMRNRAWSVMLEKVSHVLAVYPQLKGIQVMNDMGEYLFSSYQGRWIPDSPARRRAIRDRLASWTPFSNSSPVEGIEAAIRRFYARDKKISLYVFGDDFARGSIQSVTDTVRRLNRATTGTTRVRIHAVGFPTLLSGTGLSGNVVRFAALMRELAEENSGSFVGLNSLDRQR